MNSRAAFVFLASFWMLTMPAAIGSAQTAAKPKLSASAIQIALLETGDIQLPAEFRFAVYERLGGCVCESGAFQKVYRSGDHAADAVPDLVTLHTKVEGFKEGSQTVRELTTVFGATSVAVTASVTARGRKHVLTDHKITGRVRFFGENLAVTNDLAKRIAKLVKEAF